MLENEEGVKKITSSLVKYFEKQCKLETSNILKTSHPYSEETGFDDYWGTRLFIIVYELEIDTYLQYRPLIEAFCKEIKEAADLFIRETNRERLDEVRISPICRQYLRLGELKNDATKNDVLNKIEELKNILISVSTGGARIQEVNGEYSKAYCLLDQWLSRLGAENPNPYKNLWDWHGRWSQSDLSTYSSRRSFIPNLYQPLIDVITKSSVEEVTSEYVPTGWERVDRAIYEMKSRQATAITEEQYQAIGMLGRETFISVAQQVFDREIHTTDDGVDPSNTDAKRMLDAFLNYELSGSSNERTRNFAKSAVNMANHITHDRMATRREASMCLISVTAVASLIKLIDETKLMEKIAKEELSF